MRIKRLLFAVLGVLAVAGMQAETVESSAPAAEGYFYKSALLLDASGPVKEIDLKKTKDPLAIRAKVSISPDGKFVDPLDMEYDSEGLFRSMDFEMKSGLMKGLIKCSVEYDSAQLPKSLKAHLRMMKEMDLDYSYTYIEGRLSVQTVNYKFRDEKGVMSYTFSGHEYDDHGNWVKRHVKLQMKADGKHPAESDVVDYDEERTITYYE